VDEGFFVWEFTGIKEPIKMIYQYNWIFQPQIASLETQRLRSAESIGRVTTMVAVLITIASAGAA